MGNYDHDFEPEQMCATCDCEESDCTCDDDEQEIVDGSDCAICGYDESDDQHIEDEEEED